MLSSTRCVDAVFWALLCALVRRSVLPPLGARVGSDVVDGLMDCGAGIMGIGCAG